MSSLTVFFATLRSFSSVTLSGLSENFNALKDSVRNIFFEFHEAEALAKQTLWQWARTPDQFGNLPLRVSRAIEKEFQVYDFSCWL